MTSGVIMEVGTASNHGAHCALDTGSKSVVDSLDTGLDVVSSLAELPCHVAPSRIHLGNGFRASAREVCDGLCDCDGGLLDAGSDTIQDLDAAPDIVADLIHLLVTAHILRQSLVLLL